MSLSGSLSLTGMKYTFSFILDLPLPDEMS